MDQLVYKWNGAMYSTLNRDILSNVQSILQLMIYFKFGE